MVDAVNSHLADGFRLLRGIEVDILDDGSLDQSDEMLAELDVVVASVHSKLRMERSAMTRRMLAAVRLPQVDVLGHCTGRLVRGSRGVRPQSEFDAEAVFAACAEHDVAVEINSRPERCDPPDELVEVALAAGCLFSHRQRRPRPGAARLPAVRRRTGRAAGGAAGADRDHLAAGAAAGVDRPGKRG